MGCCMCVSCARPSDHLLVCGVDCSFYFLFGGGWREIFFGGERRTILSKRVMIMFANLSSQINKYSSRQGREVGKRARRRGN